MSKPNLFDRVFAGRVFCFDRNFPGHAIITAIIDAGGHVVARVKDKSPALPVTVDGWLPDGSRMSFLNAPGGKTAGRLPARVVEHNAALPCGDGEQVSETYTPHIHAARPRRRRRRGDPRGLPDPLASLRNHVRAGTRPPSPAPGAASAARYCARAARGW